MLNGTKELYEFGEFRLDVPERLLLDKNGEKVPLADKVYATLCVLVRQSGSLVRKEDLLKAVWDEAFVEENNLDKAVSTLRRALGKNAAKKFSSKPSANTVIVSLPKSRRSKTKIQSPKAKGKGQKIQNLKSKIRNRTTRIITPSSGAAMFSPSPIGGQNRKTRF